MPSLPARRRRCAPCAPRRRMGRAPRAPLRARGRADGADDASARRPVAGAEGALSGRRRRLPGDHRASAGRHRRRRYAGDRHRVGAGAHAQLTTPGAAKWYRSAGAARASSTTLRVGAGAMPRMAAAGGDPVRRRARVDRVRDRVRPERGSSAGTSPASAGPRRASGSRGLAAPVASNSSATARSFAASARRSTAERALQSGAILEARPSLEHSIVPARRRRATLLAACRARRLRRGRWRGDAPAGCARRALSRRLGEARRARILLLCGVCCGRARGPRRGAAAHLEHLTRTLDDRWNSRREKGQAAALHRRAARRAPAGARPEAQLSRGGRVSSAPRSWRARATAGRSPSS